MAGKNRGKFTTPMISVQTVLPQEIVEYVAKRAEEECLPFANFYRRAIVEWYKKEVKK